jgi:thioredoxin 1
MEAPNIIKVTDADFEPQVIQGKGLILVDFWAEWCGPCRTIAPILEELASEYGSQLKIGKLNVDENRITTAKYGIMSIPTLLLFKDGVVVDQLIGALPKAAIKAKVEAYL